MTDDAASSQIVASSLAAERTFLTCQLAGRSFALPILQVREIIGMIAVTSLPRAPAHVLGVGYHRGRLLPVIDLRRKLGLTGSGRADETCIVVVEAGRGGGAFCVGCVVDEANEVLALPASQSEPVAPPGDAGPSAKAVAGQRASGPVVLDVEQLLADLDPATSGSGE